MGRSSRTGVAAALISTLVVAGLTFGAIAAPASAQPTPTTTPTTPTPTPSPTATFAPQPMGTALAVDLTGGAILTLPAKDGLRDTGTIRIRSGERGVVNLDAISGKKVVHLKTLVALRQTQVGWQRTVRISVATLSAGSWRIRAERSTDPKVRARSGMLLVGTGAPVHVLARPAARTLYPYRDGVLDDALVTVTATDETGADVPVTGSVRIDAAKRHVTRKIGLTQVVRLPVTALPLGPATLTTTVRGPAGGGVRKSTLTLAPTGVGTLRVARSSDTVQPVVDGLLDSVVLTTSGAASAGSPATVSGTLTVTRGATVAAQFFVPDGGQHAFTWDGRVNGALVAGTYTVTLSLKGPQGVIRTTTKTVLVSAGHLPYRVQDLFTVAAGNQQGLAVRNGYFYVGFDVGNDQARIDVYDGGGHLISSLGPLPIGHVAELSYSTTTGLLYAANGGSTTPTKVWAIDPQDPQWTASPQTDPSAAIRATFDLSALGNNGMVTVDDANARLLVFAGAPGAYTITPVSMNAVPQVDSAGNPVLDSSGNPVTTPAGTPGTSVPIAVSGMPQGMELVGQQLWVYTSLQKKNHIAQYDVSTMLPSASAGASADVMYAGEGEGLAFQSPPQGTTTGNALPEWIYVGAHSANRIGLLVPVADG